MFRRKCRLRPEFFIGKVYLRYVMTGGVSPNSLKAHNNQKAESDHKRKLKNENLLCLYD